MSTAIAVLRQFLLLIIENSLYDSYVYCDSGTETLISRCAEFNLKIPMSTAIAVLRLFWQIVFSIIVRFLCLLR